MFYSQDRQQLRQFFFNAWQKSKARQPLEPMEQIIANVLQQHPEYQGFFEDLESNLDKDFSPEAGETNPFLHISMHITIHEQLSMNQPAGIQDYYQKILHKTGDAHAAEHEIMDCIGEMIWKAQRENRSPSEKDYFACLQLKAKR